MVTAVMILAETDSNLQKCAQNEILSGDWPGITSFGHLVLTAWLALFVLKLFFDNLSATQQAGYIRKSSISSMPAATPGRRLMTSSLII